MPAKRDPAVVEADAPADAVELPKYRSFQYLGPEENFKCFATSPPLEFNDGGGRVCHQVPETTAKVLIDCLTKKGAPVFRDITKGVKALVPSKVAVAVDEDWEES
ncbi:MAG: hypothetical protein FJZ00_01465 [Candidatus Sericytochromatia bacterium]|uniref:Uncharacterized protein n=1 Tax=Candidatus Tanganyikabacteria bacterium TaxID=2961651 RepID=A0A937X0K9_9BACT|nr:hypothetical protein [Candidatus Tanganyikabacteria bacterium]